VGARLCVAGAATLASVGWGLKDQGLYCVAAMLVALIAARGLANESQRVCAASLPARITYVAAKLRRIHATMRGREITSRRTAAANTP
jgi:hypothetical protein